MNYLESNIWFPYFSLHDKINLLNITSASGVKLKLQNGMELIDGVSSWWAMAHGYNNPYIVNAIKKQADVLCHVMFGGIVHEKAIEASTRLVNFLETKYLKKVFFSDSGSTAVEVGIKMAIQYFFETGNVAKNKIIYFEDGYHGETFGALSFSDCMHSFFPSLPNKILMKIPQTEEDFTNFESFINANKHEIAGAIMEPIMQGAGGIKLHNSYNIKRLWQILQLAGILIIADECATGFYRLGCKFAFTKIGLEPDILILGKALTGGHLPLACTIAKEFIFEGICGGSRFFHGPTFMANPLCLSALVASLDLFESTNYSKKVLNIESILQEEFKEYNARIIGAVCGFTISKEMNLHVKKEVASGKTKSFLRPFGTTLYTMPPLIIEEEELKIITSDIKRYVLPHQSH